MRKNDAKFQMKKGIIALLEKKYYLDITVTDLVKQSGVARASFYRRYQSIEQLIDDVIEEIKEGIEIKYMSTLVKNDAEQIKKVILKFYTDVKNKNVPFVDIPLENQQYISNKIFSKETMLQASGNGSMVNYIPGIKLTVILVLSKFWKDNNYAESPEELTEIAYNCIKNL